MNDVQKAAAFLTRMNYANVRSFTLNCTLPDFEREVDYITTDPEPDLLDIFEIKVLLREYLKAQALYDVGFSVELWKQNTNCLRLLVDVKGPENHPYPYANVLINFSAGDFNIEVVDHEYDYEKTGTLYEMEDPTIVRDAIGVIGLGKISKSIRWSINATDKDTTLLDQLFTIFEGFGYTCVSGHVVDQERLAGDMSISKAFSAKRDGVEIRVCLESDFTRQRNKKYVVELN